jgi:16S rRNA (cytosine1402-N4)-methyltransferase
MLQEAVDFLVTDSAGSYVDGTFGRGGHTRAILGRLAPAARLLAIDHDPEAIAAGAQPVLATIRASSSSMLPSTNCTRCWSATTWQGRVHGVLLDLGVSSPQLDDPRRGFSFLQDGPLDMRMNPGRGISAAQWLARARAEDIAQVLFEYGEERFARRMAAAIVRERSVEPIETTARLAQIVAAANPAWEKAKHPATRAFQAIRIYINGELDALASVLRQALDALLPWRPARGDQFPLARGPHREALHA